MTRWICVRNAALLCTVMGCASAVYSADMIELPNPNTAGALSLERLLAQRRSVRSYPPGALGLREVGQLLWAAQGITDPQGLRTAPSAGALYSLELYLVAGAVEGLAPGIYHYNQKKHRLLKHLAGNRLEVLARAALGQDWVRDAAAVVVLAAVYQRTTGKYGDRGVRYVHIEAGHAGQNLFLQAEALGLGTVVVGAFDDDQVAGVLDLPKDERPLMLMPIGRK